MLNNTLAEALLHPGNLSVLNTYVPVEKAMTVVSKQSELVISGSLQNNKCTKQGKYTFTLKNNNTMFIAEL